jgi:hypothetical protein
VKLKITPERPAFRKLSGFLSGTISGTASWGLTGPYCRHCGRYPQNRLGLPTQVVNDKGRCRQLGARPHALRSSVVSLATETPKRSLKSKIGECLIIRKRPDERNAALTSKRKLARKRVSQNAPPMPRTTPKPARIKLDFLGPILVFRRAMREAT